MHRLLKEICASMDFKSFPCSLNCTVFEDNNGCIELAKLPKMRPRTKHIAIKYHFFRDHVITDSNKTGFVNIIKVDTKFQLADLLTKAFAKPAFERLKELIGVAKANEFDHPG